MKENHIEVSKTARYFTLENENATQVWYLLHGYGMPATAMLKAVEKLDKKNILFVAPEGLSRFYWNGYSGAIVPSWMTKEDRENEIKDYVAYLEKLNQRINPTGLPVNVLGFSQGVATASRWIAQSAIEFSQIVWWAGEPAMDIDYSAGNKFKAVTMVIGNEDPFFKKSAIDLMKVSLIKAGLNITLKEFEGKHELNEVLLNQLIG